MARSDSPRPLASVYSWTARPSGRWPKRLTEAIGSDPAAIDDEVLRGAHRAVVGREEHRHARDVLGQQRLVDALAARDLLAALVVDPEADLLFGHDPAGHQGVDPDLVRPEVARQAACQALHGGLRSGVDRQVALLELP